jgi:hypothetical protein
MRFIEVLLFKIEDNVLQRSNRRAMLRSGIARWCSGVLNLGARAVAAISQHAIRGSSV